MGTHPDFELELAELISLTNAHLRWELELGNPVLSDQRPAPVHRGATESVEGPRSHAAPASPPSGSPKLATLQEEAAACTRCKLHRGRTKSVFARGNPSASIVFVGEGPGYHEDQQGSPFVGKAGQLLDKMIAAMGMGEDEIYICNVVKCRPPDNRTPTPDEAAACRPFLTGQLAEVAPEVIVALGRHASENLGSGGRGWRGAWGTFEGIDVMSTYHPAYLLRSPEQKRAVWQDLQAVVAALGRELPQKS